MTIQIGEKIPHATLNILKDGVQAVSTEELFEGKKVVLFAVPGAFTPTCSAKHLPGYAEKFGEFEKRGIEVACLSVNDAFVMDCWGKDRKVGDKVTLLADGNAEFSRALGLDFDGSGFGMGIRAQRFSALVEDGVVKSLHVEAPGKFEVSRAEGILEDLK